MKETGCRHKKIKNTLLNDTKGNKIEEKKLKQENGK